MQHQNYNQVQHVHPQQPQQPQIQEMKFKADEEVLQILNSTYPELINSAINIAIKRFSKTTEYNNYYKLASLRDEMQDEENDEVFDANAASTINNTNNVTNASSQTVVSQTASAPVADFSTW